MRIYMNGYEKWPKNIPLPSNVEYILAPGKLDKGSQGKLHWLDNEPGYYMTVDDDIYYPKNYVETHVRNCDKFKHVAITSFHGQRFMIPHLGRAPLCKEDKGMRSIYGYNKHLPQDCAGHMVGNGVMCCVPSVIGLTTEAVCGPKDSGDDEDIAMFAQRTKTPLVILNHISNWIRPDEEQRQIEASFQNKDFLRKQNEKLQTWPAWEIHLVSRV